MYFFFQDNKKVRVRGRRVIRDEGIWSSSEHFFLGMEEEKDTFTIWKLR